MHGRKSSSAKFYAFIMVIVFAVSSVLSLQAQGVRQTAPQRTPAIESGDANLSELQFSRGLRRAAPQFEEAQQDASSLIKPTSNAFLFKRPQQGRWNSAVGRKVFADQLALGARQGTLQSLGLDFQTGGVTPRSANFDGDIVCTEPDIVKEGSKCCSYTIKDQLNNVNVVYRQPLHVFSNETKSREFAGTVRASMPMFVPYKSSHVRAGHGWIYNSGSFHGAVDYGKDEYKAGEDPAFKIHSIADGTVVSVLWDNWSGNIVVIEHVAPNGDRYRSAYKHMRNGFDNDLAKAKAITVAEDKKFDDKGKATNTWKYYQYARKANPSTLQWGTNAQKIAVKVGDKVGAGQFIGWSGNTGPGGAGNGLDDNGNPKNSVTANNHLHLMMTVPDPTPGSKDWVQIDPYGVYSEVDTACYDLGDDTPYARLFAPFYPSFHNVPVGVVAKYFGYYPGMGYGLQTLSLHRNGNKVYASGSFQRGLPGAWYARFYMTGDDFQHWFDEYHKKGFRPREINVVKDGNGNPRFNVIWKKRANEGYYAYFGLTDNDYKAKWQQHVVQGKMRVEDRFTYTANGSPRHAAIFVGDGNTAFYEYHYMSGESFAAKFDELAKAGFKMTSINVEEVSGTFSYGGVWTKGQGGWYAFRGMTASQYQSKFDELGKQGFRLHKVQGYADSDRFAAIWVK